LTGEALKEFVDTRMASMLRRPGMWAGVPESLEAQILTLLEVRDFVEDEKTRTDNVLSRYQRFCHKYMPSKPGPVPLSTVLSLDDLATALTAFVAVEKVRE